MSISRWNDHYVNAGGNWRTRPAWFEQFYDFTTDEDATAMVVSAIASGTGAVVDTIAGGGVFQVNNNSTDENSGANFHVDAAPFSLVAGATIQWKARFKVTDADQTDLWLGLFPVDTDLIGGVTDGIWFQLTDASAAMAFNAYAGSASILAATARATIADATWTELAFSIVMDPTTAAKGEVRAYIDGVEVYKGTHTNLPATTVYMTCAGTYLSGAASDMQLDLDYIGARQSR